MSFAILVVLAISFAIEAKSQTSHTKELEKDFFYLLDKPAATFVPGLICMENGMITGSNFKKPYTDTLGFTEFQ